jgi:hypothetical protein
MFGRGVLCSLLVVAGCDARVTLGASTGLAGSGGGPSGAGGQAGEGGRVRDPNAVQAGFWMPAMDTNDSSNDAVTLPVTGTSLCGTGTTMRRKSIALAQAATDAGASDLVLGQAFLYANSAAEANLLATVTNTGNTMHCRIHAVPNQYRWLDSQGTPAIVINGPTIVGSEGDVGDTHLVSSCLAPGETGLIFDVQSPFPPQDVWAVTASVEVALTYDGDGVAPAAVLVPQTFTFDGTNIALHFQNVGTGPAGFPSGLAQYTRYVLIDGGGQPLFFGSLLESLDSPVPDVANSRDTGTARSLDRAWLSEFFGCAVAVRAWVAFDGAAGLAK